MRVRLTSITYQQTPTGGMPNNANAPTLEDVFVYTFMPVVSESGTPYYSATAIQIPTNSPDDYNVGQVYELTLNSLE